MSRLALDVGCSVLTGCAAPPSTQPNGRADACWPAHGSHLRLLNKRIVDTEFFTEGSYVSHILLAPDPPIRPVEEAERACHMRPEHLLWRSLSWPSPLVPLWPS